MHLMFQQTFSYSVLPVLSSAPPVLSSAPPTPAVLPFTTTKDENKREEIREAQKQTQSLIKRLNRTKPSDPLYSVICQHLQTLMRYNESLMMQAAAVPPRKDDDDNANAFFATLLNTLAQQQVKMARMTLDDLYVSYRLFSTAPMGRVLFKKQMSQKAGTLLQTVGKAKLLVIHVARARLDTEATDGVLAVAPVLQV